MEEGATHIDKHTSLAAEGIAIEPFSMQEENSDGRGYFEGDTYVFRRRDADDQAEPDAWLESVAGGGDGETEEQRHGAMEAATKPRRKIRA